MSYSTYAVIMLAAGLGIPVMAALNAALGKIIGNPAGAVVMLFSRGIRRVLHAFHHLYFTLFWRW